jgi:hypothetical protein
MSIRPTYLLVSVPGKYSQNKISCAFRRRGSTGIEAIQPYQALDARPEGVSWIVWSDAFIRHSSIE